VTVLLMLLVVLGVCLALPSTRVALVLSIVSMFYALAGIAAISMLLFIVGVPIAIIVAIAGG
jgi:hypothetical protein